MNFFPTAVLLGFALAFASAGRAAPSTSPSRYGEPANFLDATLNYPDFTVRYQQRTEYALPGTNAPWVTQVFEVLDHERHTIGGNITFNSSETANARRFDVRGKIYVAEMFYTTAGVAEGRPHLILPRPQLIVWDEASAKARNPILYKIWTRETITPGARYSSTNAYADGEVFADFKPFSALGARADPAGAGPIRSEVSVVSSKNLPSVADGRKSAYGNRVSFRDGVMAFPDFSVQLSEYVEVNQTRPGSDYVPHFRYEFLVFGPSGFLTRFMFDSSHLANGRRLDVGGATYFVEMFATTAGVTAPGTTTLRPDELIIWNRETAAAKNPRVVAAWQPGSPQADPRIPSVFAAGVALGHSFTGTYIIGDARTYCPLKELDAPLATLQRSAAVYPPELKGSGFVGRISGFLIVRPDGTVEQAVATHGYEDRFRKVAQDALLQWKFFTPMKEGKPVRALLSFTWIISEPAQPNDGVEFY